MQNFPATETVWPEMSAGAFAKSLYRIYYTLLRHKVVLKFERMPWAIWFAWSNPIRKPSNCRTCAIAKNERIQNNRGSQKER